MGGVHWGRLLSLEGDARTRLAGMSAPTAATWGALLGRYTACLHDGAPASLVSDSGGASTSADVAAGCTRLQIRHETLVSTPGESEQNWLATHVHGQRRLYDYQGSVARTPAAWEPRPQAFIQAYHTPAPPGRLKDHRFPAIPGEVFGTAQGRVYTPEERARPFAQAVLPRTTNRPGGVTLPSSHVYVAEGLPRTPVLLWVAGAPLRAGFEHVVRAEYRGHDEWRDRTVQDIQDGRLYPTRVAARPGRRIPLTPHDSGVVDRRQSPKRRVPHVSPPPPWLLFEVVAPGEGRLQGAPVSRMLWRALYLVSLVFKCRLEDRVFPRC
jgi:hypothetical protein